MIIEEFRPANDNDRLYSHLSPEVEDALMFPEFLASFSPLVENFNVYFVNFIQRNGNETFSVQSGLFGIAQTQKIYKALTEAQVFLGAFVDKKYAEQVAILERAINNMQILFEGRCEKNKLIRAAEDFHEGFNTILESDMNMLSNLNCADIAKTMYR